jgi:hypothetical protein
MGGGQAKRGSLDKERELGLVARGGFESRLRHEREGEAHGRSEGTRRGAALRRCAEEKLCCGVAVSVKESLNQAFGVTPWHLGPEAEGHEVACHFFPGESLFADADCAEVVKPHKHPVPPAKPP